jgi:hypothetical protein
MNIYSRLCFFLIAAAALPFALAAQTPDVSGTWLSDSDASLKWVLDQTPSEIHVKQISGDKVEADFTCPLSGRDCKIKGGERSETIMMYFNGAKLVEIRERGNNTAKFWFIVSADGKTLSISTVPLTSNEKAETTSFHRQTTKMS